MYIIDNEIGYRVINVNNGRTSKWCLSESELFVEIQKILAGELKKKYSMPSIVTAISAVKFHENDIGYYQIEYDDWDRYQILPYANRRCLMIYDNFGRMIPPNKLESVYYDYAHKRYEVKNEGVVRYNRKKQLRKRDNGYRKESVSGTSCRKSGGYRRKISYKGTQLLAENDQCKEAGIKGYRPNRVLDTWDIEPFQERKRCWKDNYKVRKQYMIHAP